MIDARDYGKTIFQYVLKNNQETCIDKFKITEQYYGSFDEAVKDWEQELLFSVWAKFVPPDFIPRERRKNAQAVIVG